MVDNDNIATCDFDSVAHKWTTYKLTPTFVGRGFNPTWALPTPQYNGTFTTPSVQSRNARDPVVF